MTGFMKVPFVSLKNSNGKPYKKQETKENYACFKEFQILLLSVLKNKGREIDNKKCAENQVMRVGAEWLNRLNAFQNLG